MTPRLVRVIPLARMPRTLGFFDYILPKGMSVDVGALVMIPFRGRKIPGLVIKRLRKSNVPKARMKEILDLVEAPPLAKPVIDTLLKLAEESLTSPATTARALLPTLPKRQIEAEMKAKIGPQKSGARNHEPPLWREALKNGASLFVYDNRNEREAFLEMAWRRAQASGQPLLFITPRVQLAKDFITSHEKDSVLVTGEGSMITRWKNWIQSHKASVVAGTALALFTPHRKPFAILVDEEDAPEHQHGDSAPRFDSRKIAESLAKSWGCPIIFLSTTPSVASWNRLGKDMRLIPSEQRLKIRTVICDFADEFRSERFLPVAQTFLTGLDVAMTSEKRAIIIINRKGDSARLICRDCRKIPSCDACNTVALAVHGSKLICPRCRMEKAMPDICSSCGGTRLAGSGAGIERIASFLSERYKKARVKIFTKELHESSSLDADILLGTEYMMTHAYERLLSEHGIGFVGTLSADTFLVYLSDAMTEERAYRRLRRLALLATNHGLPMYLQTSKPELPLYAMLAMTPEKWYACELEDRKSANTYPFSNIARLVASGKNYEQLKKMTESLVSHIKDEKFFSIFEVRIFRHGSRNRAWIGISFPQKNEANVRRALIEILPESWGYDPSPFNAIA